MSNDINFNTLGTPTSFNFGQPGNFNDFNFTEGGYTPDYDFNFGTGATSYNFILKGLSDNFSAIWADTDASLSNGKMYISSAAAFMVVNLSTDLVEDYYTETHAGEAGESLTSNDIVDNSVV